MLRNPNTAFEYDIHCKYDEPDGVFTFVSCTWNNHWFCATFLLHV